MYYFRLEQTEQSNDPLLGALIELAEHPTESGPNTVLYLNPLVLRKELENVLSQEGDSCLTKQKFILEHPIVYWNLIWYFERINCSSHLPELWLHNDKKKELQCSSTNLVGVRTLWDNPKLHMDQLPMYLQLRLNTVEDRSYVSFCLVSLNRKCTVNEI